MGGTGLRQLAVLKFNEANEPPFAVGEPLDAPLEMGQVLGADGPADLEASQLEIRFPNADGVALGAEVGPETFEPAIQFAVPFFVPLFSGGEALHRGVFSSCRRFHSATSRSSTMPQ